MDVINLLYNCLYKYNNIIIITFIIVSQKDLF